MRYPNHLKPSLPRGVHPLPELMRNNGYFTANIKNPFGSGKIDWMFQYNQKEFDGDDWSQLNENQPFYAQVNFSMVHRPYRQDKQNPINPKTVTLPPYYPDHPIARQDWAAYLESVQILDRQVGKVLDRLDQSGLADNTIVFFFTDHGRAMTRGKYWHYESGIHVPFIARFPQGIEPPSYQAGTANHQLISAIDITATTLALAGIPLPKPMQGRPFYGKKANPPRDHVFAASDRIGEWEFQTRSATGKRFKYIRHDKHGFSINEASTAYRKAYHPIYHVLKQLHEKNRLNPHATRLCEPLPPEELYDLKNDPWELNNLAKDPKYQETKKKLKTKLDKWIKETNDQGFADDSPKIKEAFQQYGVQSYHKYKKKIKAQAERVRKTIKG
ncbi:sulfatase-like hydrolase/transferase [bacterium]|nr:sulfatase-like hydrolase/transferase [bacterium]